MGDVGALALGAALGTIAVIVRQEIVLFIMGGVFVVETLSVMMQVASFKCDRRQAHLPHGAAAPPLRAEGLEGEPGRGALLDHHDDAGAVRPVDAEAADDARAAPSRLLPRPAAVRAGRASGCSCSASATPACRWRAGSRAQGGRRARRRHARTRRRGARTSPGELHTGAVHAARCSTASTWSASAPACRSREPVVQAALARGIPVVGDIELFAWRCTTRSAQGARDHRHQRQDHRHRAGRRTCCARRGRLRGRGQHRAAGARRAARARDAAAPRRSCSSSPATSWRPPGRSTPHAAAMLNLTEDHLDRYAGIAEYARRQGAHLRRPRRAGAQPRRSRARWRWRCRRSAGAHLRPRRAARASDCGVDAATRWLRGGAPTCCASTSCRSTALHNAANALAACALAGAIGVPTSALARRPAQLQGPAAPRWSASPSCAASPSTTIPRAPTSARRSPRSTGLAQARGADRRRRRQGPGLRAARAGRSRAHARARAC